MPLRTLVSDGELRLLEAALRWLESASQKAFAQLFDSLDVVPKLPDAVAAPFLAFDLAERAGEGVRGLLRVRRHGGRFYVMGIGLGAEVEYQQDVWPETDALLDALETDSPCRLLDLGTGCGIVAVEAAARGHQVVATDLYQPTMVLARFNARLNRLAEGIEWRQGHLWEPVAGERFDRVLTNPHYGRSDDQLRLELLRGVPEHLAPGGRLLLATALEWDDEAAPRTLGVECVLRPLVAAGLDVVVRPLRSAYKRNWFAVARGQPGLSSRQRFTIEVTAPPSGANASARVARLDVTWPDEPDAPVRHFVALERLTRGGERATTTTAAGAARLAELAAKLAAPDVTFHEPLPAGLLDSCRWGARECVGPRGAAGAIVSAGGSVRPCTHGPQIAHAGETLMALMERYQQLAGDARARRGCATCPAEPSCSRCLFPVALDDDGYCALVRQNAASLPTLLRLFDVVAHLDESGVAQGPLRVRRWPRDDRPLPGAAAEWSRLQAWIVERAGRPFVCFPQRFFELEPAAAELCAAFADGAAVDQRASALFTRLLGDTP